MIVTWGDGDTEEFTTPGNKSHTYDSDGQYTVTVSGTVTGFGSDSVIGIDKLTGVTAFDTELTDLENGFSGAINLTSVPNSIPNVTNLISTFKGAINFNTDISTWDVSSVSNMSEMFNGATTFNRSLANWTPSSVSDFTSFFSGGSGLDTTNYNQTLISWDNKKSGPPSFQTPLTIDFGTSKYTLGGSAETARTNLINYGWTINDGGPFPEVILNIDTNLITGTTYDIYFINATNVDIDWGDSSSDIGYTGRLISHTYSTDGVYKINIIGNSVGIGRRATTSNFTTNAALTSTENQSLENLTNINGLFNNSDNLTSVSAYLQPTIINARYLFCNSSVTSVTNLDLWDTKNIQNFNSAFRNCPNFNQNLNNWDVSSATFINVMFFGCSNFNQPLNNWDVSNVRSIDNIFRDCSSFNQPLNNWDVSSVVNMKQAFRNCVVFNQPLNNWDISNAADMSNMFNNADSFDQTLEDWTPSSVSNFTNFFTSGAGLSTSNYDSTLISWNSKKNGPPAFQTPININFGTSTYTLGGSAETARTALVAYGWTISDGGGV